MKHKMSRNTKSEGVTKAVSITKEDHQILDFKAHAARAEAVGDWKSAAKSYAQ